MAAGKRSAKTTTKKKSTKKRAAVEELRFPCLPINQSQNEQLVVFVASAKALWDIVKVDQRTENKDEGYQRALASPRVGKIAQYINAGRVIPTSVLISFDEASLEDNGATLVVPKKPGVGWVIDGQHRLAGAHEAARDIDIPVVAFLNLPVDAQIAHFVTVNREQKGVPSSLYLELLKHLPGNKTDAQIADERATDLASAMKTDEDSPFFGKIVTTTSPKQGQLSTTNFVRKVAPLLKKNGRLHAYSDGRRAGIINNYYRALANVFPKEYQRDDSIFFQTLGFGAVMNVLPTFIDITLGREKSFKVVAATATFKRIDWFDFEPWHSQGTGSAAESFAAEQLRSELQSAVAATGAGAEIDI